MSCLRLWFLILLAGVAMGAVTNSTRPVVTGELFAGKVLTSSDGVWDPLTCYYSYQWQISSSNSGANPTTISGNTTNTYSPTLADVGKYFSCKVTAADGLGNSTLLASLWVGPILSSPINSAVPVITGTKANGHAITSSSGAWNDTASLNINYSYAWQRANDINGAGAAAIAGGTSSIYTLTATDVGKYVACTVTADDQQGSHPTARSAWTQVVANHAPVIQTVPAVTGTIRVTGTLNASTGTWADAESDPLTYTYAWQYADSSDGTGTTLIDDQSGNSYTPDSGKEDKYISSIITADDGANGLASTTTAWVGPIVNPPTAAHPPSLTGNTWTGQTLTVDKGTWSGGRHATLYYSYQWKHGIPGNLANATPIGGNAATYVLTSSDYGTVVTCTVTADNGFGGINSATCAWVGLITASPINTAAPSISGSAITGHVLTSTTGLWNDVSGLTISYSYAWQRADDINGNGIAAIQGATSSTYTLSSDLATKYVACIVTASDGQHHDTNKSSDWILVKADTLPINATPPVASGTAKIGSTLTAATGSWTDADNDTLTYHYLWQTSSTSTGASPTPITSAIVGTYTPIDSDAEKYMACIVIADDGYGGLASATTNWLGPILSPPVITTAPAVTTLPVTTATVFYVGTTLSTDKGTWAGKYHGSLSYTYQWQRSASSVGTAPIIIAGATTSTYVTKAVDATQYLSCLVSVDDGHGGTASATSNWFGPMVAVPTGTPSFIRGADVSARETSSTTDMHIFPAWATSISANGAAGALAFTATLATSDAANFRIAPMINPNGDLFFAPKSGITTDTTVTVTVILKAGTTSSAPQTFVITILHGPDSPTTATFGSGLTAVVAGTASKGTLTGISANGTAGTVSSGTSWSVTTPVSSTAPTPLAIAGTASDANPGSTAITIDIEPVPATVTN